MRWEVLAVLALCTAPLSLLLASVLVCSCYVFVWVLYLLYGSNSMLYRAFPPLSPLRVFRIIAYLITYLQCHFFTVRTWSVFSKWTWNALMSPSETRGRVKKNIFYRSDQSPTHILDVYTPKGALRRKKSPPDFTNFTNFTNSTNGNNCHSNNVIIIACGSLGSISKSVAIPLAQSLQAQGYTVVLPQYTRSKHVLIGDLIADLSDVIDWTITNINRFGGDSSKIYLLGYSTGALVCNLLVLDDASRKAGSTLKPLPMTIHRGQISESSENVLNGNSDSTSILYDKYSPRVHGMILLSGIFDVLSIHEWLESKGMEELHSIPRMMGNPLNLQEYKRVSPSHLLYLEISNHQVDLNIFCQVLPRKWLFLDNDRYDKYYPPSTSSSFIQILISLLAPNKEKTLLNIGGNIDISTKISSNGLIRAEMIRSSTPIHLNPLIDLVVPTTRLSLELSCIVNDFVNSCGT